MEKTLSNQNYGFDIQGETKETFEHLIELEKEIKNEINQQESQEGKATFYKALGTIIDLKLNVEEVNHNFENILEVFLTMATGDFGKRLDVSNRKNIFSLLSLYLNKVNEELSENVVKKHILEEALELSEDFALVTDLKGTILCANSAACKILNLNKDSIAKLIVATIFESKSQFGIKGSNGEGIQEEQVVLIPYNAAPIQVLLSIKKLEGTEGPDSYLYRASLKK